MGLTERHWFEDEEEARRWLEERKEKKMVVYEAIVSGHNYGEYEDFQHFTYSFGLYKSYYSAFKVILNINDQKVFNNDWYDADYDAYNENELRPLEDDIKIPEGCVRAITNRIPIVEARKYWEEDSFHAYESVPKNYSELYCMADWDYFFYIKEREVLD